MQRQSQCHTCSQSQSHYCSRSQSLEPTRQSGRKLAWSKSDLPCQSLHLIETGVSPVNRACLSLHFLNLLLWSSNRAQLSLQGSSILPEICCWPW